MCKVIASSDTVISDPTLQTFSFVAVDASGVLGTLLFQEQFWMVPRLTVVLKCLGEKEA